MARIALCIGVLLVGCGGSVWIEMRRSRSLFLGADATEVQIRVQRSSTWQITYYAPGSPATWHSDVARQLEANGWGTLDMPAYGGLSRTYTHVVSFGVVEIWVWAHLTLNPLQPHNAHILVRRSIALPRLSGCAAVVRMLKPCRAVESEYRSALRNGLARAMGLL
jgi:hypothetical protein